MASRCRLYEVRERRVYEMGLMGPMGPMGPIGPMSPIGPISPISLLVVNLRPRQLPDEHDFLVDLALRGFVAEDAAEIFDFRGDELVVLRKEALRGALEIAFRYGDLLQGTHEGFAHG